MKTEKQIEELAEKEFRNMSAPDTKNKMCVGYVIGYHKAQDSCKNDLVDFMKFMKEQAGTYRIKDMNTDLVVESFLKNKG